MSGRCPGSPPRLGQERGTTAFTGLGAFPLTPLVGGQVDEKSFGRIVEGLAASGVDSITTLGSTGSAAYLDTGERARVAALPGIASVASDRLAPLRDLFDAHGGSMRVIAVVEELGLI